MESVRIYEMPKCKMVSSKCGMLGEAMLDDFNNWMETLPRPMFPQDFLWFDEQQGGFVWYYIYSEGMTVPDTFEIVDFPGGLYAVTTGIDGKGDDEALDAIAQFIETKTGFARDDTRKYLGNVITPPAAEKSLGYLQMDYYMPIKVV